MQPSRQAKELMSWTKRKRRDKHICGYSKKIKIKIKKNAHLCIIIKTRLQLPEQRQDQKYADTQGTFNKVKRGTYCNTPLREKKEKNTNIRRACVLLACLLAS